MTGRPPGTELRASARDALQAVIASLGDGTFLAAPAQEEVEARLDALAEPFVGVAGGAVSAALAGCTLAVKDNIDVAGLPTTGACPARTRVPQRSATVVDRLEDAGAVVVGKTNLDQFATGLVGVRSPDGGPANPLAAELVPGGSSSGSAVAVARGMADLALGTDTAGSGRVPAAMTGVVGLKPAPGRVPTDGVEPACWSLDCPSLFAADLGTVVAAGAVLDPVTSWRPVAPGRVGVPDAVSLDGVAPAVIDGLAEAARLLGGHGPVDEVDLAPLVAVGDLLYGGAWLAERTAALGDLIEQLGDAVHPVVRDVVLGGRRWAATDAFAAVHRRDELAAGPVAELWRSVDVLVVPTVPWLPTRAEEAADPVGVNRRLGRFTHFANLLGLAALAVPVPAAPRSHPAVPLGVTLLAPPGREGMLVATAARLGAPGGEALVAAPGSAVPADRQADGAPAGPRIEVAVVGAHLSGFPLNHQLLEPGGTLAERTTTAPTYRLHRLPGDEVPRPALERVGEGGAAIEVEVWSLPLAALGPFTASVGRPLAIGTVTLADGREVAGFVCEHGGLAGATDITTHGGWRAYTAAVA